MANDGQINEAMDVDLAYELKRRFANDEIAYWEYARERAKLVGRPDVLSSLVWPVILEILAMLGFRR